MEVAGLAIQDRRLGGEDFAKPVEPHSSTFAQPTYTLAVLMS